MYKYKEIQPQTYLELDNGKIYCSIEEILRIINFSAEGNFKNSISRSRLNKLLANANINWQHIDRQHTMLLINTINGSPEDLHAASLSTLSVLDSESIAKLLNVVSSLKPTKNGTNNLYEEEEWGVISPKNDNMDLYYSMDRITYDIQGHLSSGHKSSSSIRINQKSVLKMARKFAKQAPDYYKLITVPSNKIDFNSSKIHANTTESYANLDLHDKLIVHYKHLKGISLKREMENLDSILHPLEPVSLYIRRNLKEVINGNSDAFSITLNDADIRAIDRSISRKYKRTKEYVFNRFEHFDKEINHRNADINKYNQMRESLKNFLNGDYYNNVIGANFKNSFFKGSLKRQIEDIINIF
ncbi:MAG: hypothetical protein H9843_05635 [Candidatus Limosilactobacillus merdavium]|uniref:Uncharacterized protein n=1 Tax=Candidatus Limosilactobacillus merdavium TaxID=2838651 RepID=A0A9E2KVR9_9LACO|nr:hypothetical protein [Candidatus Limosilactobacillus merdavium]